MMTESTSMPKKTPAHTNPRYVAARVRKLLAAKGWPIRVVTGRYSPFDSKQVATEGFSVGKVGCGKHVAVDYTPSLRNGRGGDVPREVRAARRAEAFEYLRSLGYRVDERGWIDCDSYDECDR